MFTRTSRAKRRIGAAVLAALVGSLLAFASPAGALANAEAGTERFAGANRYDTAAKIALDENWDAGAANIVVVNGENFPDGLAAGALGGRILLVRADSIPAETSAAIAALKCNTAPVGCATNGPGIASLKVVGGTGVVSSAVMEALGVAAGVTPSRLSGADRYATALAVAKSISATPGNIVMATGENFPDALAAGPFALKLSAPIVLTSGSSLRADVKTYVTAMAPAGEVYLIGGTGAIPASVEAEIRSMGKNVTRLAGADREATAVAVSTAIGATGDESAILVNRNGFADALAAAPFAHQGDVDGSIMLVGNDAIPAATAGWHAANCATLGAQAGGAATDVGKIYAAGGTAVVSASVLTGAAAASKCVPFTASATCTSGTQSNAVINVKTLVQVGGADVWTAANGPQLTGVTGSAAGGLAGNGWDVVFAKATGAAIGGGDTAAITAAKVLTVTLDGDATIATMTQQQFVARFNAIPEAAALFTASARASTASGQADGTKLDAAAVAAGATVTNTITVTFSAPVTGAVAGKLPVTTDFAKDGSAGFEAGAVSYGWISSAATTGQSVFTLTSAGSTATCAAGDHIDIADNKLKIASSGANPGAVVAAIS